ncbi:MAG: hypothetical protein ACRC51_10480 [Cetobacterium sp.]
MQEEKGVKIGARVLDDDTLRILIPDYESIFSEIEKIRGNITPVETQDENKTGLIKPSDDEFFKHHNNIFSILGERGAGKTSVQLTLKYKLGQIDDVINSDKTEEKDVVKHVAKDVDTILPIIVPQDMDDDSSVIGWIIAHFSNIIKDLFKVEERCYYFNEKDEEKIKKLKARFEDLKKSYFLRQDTYKSSLSVEDTIHNYVQKNEEVIRENIDLSKKFKIFIDEFIEFRKNNKKTNPLIFIFFDDVDISNKRCLMVLETLLRYLSHSNIVVFVAGDYLTFKETITLSYLKEDGLLDKELMVQTFEKKSALEIRQTLAYDYLKKVLSPALRYELKTLSLENKKTFKCKKDSLSLGELLKEKVQFFDPFYEILDSKPRGLINIYYFLKNTDSNMDVGEFKRFTNTIIDSSSVLNVKKEEIEKIIKFNLGIEINFTKFDRNDYTETNLKILLLVLFLGEQKESLIKEHEKEILEYFRNYLNEKIEIIGEARRKSDIFDVFLEGKELSNNLNLFYDLLMKFGGKKITQDKFYQEYFLKVIDLNKEIVTYYSKNIYINRVRVIRIIEKLKLVRNTFEFALANELGIRFKNLYLIDEVVEILNKPLEIDKTLDYYKKLLEYDEGEVKRREIFLSDSELILKNIENKTCTLEQELDRLSDKLHIFKERIDYLKKILEEDQISISNLEEESENIVSNSFFRKDKNTTQINEIENIKNNIVGAFARIGTQRFLNSLKEIVLEKEKFNISYNELNEKLYKTNIFVENLRDIITLKATIDGDEALEFLDSILISTGDITLLNYLIESLEIKKIQMNIYSFILMTSKLFKLGSQELPFNFSEMIKLYKENYKKIKINQLLSYESEVTNEELEWDITDKILEIEDDLKSEKIIFEVRDLSILEIIKNSDSQFDTYLNNSNYINVKKLGSKHRVVRGNMLLSNNKDLQSFFKKNFDSVLKVIDRSKVLDLEVYIEFFKVIYKERNFARLKSNRDIQKIDKMYEKLESSKKMNRYLK